MRERENFGKNGSIWKETGGHGRSERTIEGVEGIRKKGRTQE